MIWKHLITKKNNILLAVENQFTFARITEYDVYCAFGLFKAEGSGYDGWSYTMLLFSLDFIVAAITEFYNACLEEGHFPSV